VPSVVTPDAKPGPADPGAADAVVAFARKPGGARLRRRARHRGGPPGQARLDRVPEGGPSSAPTSTGTSSPRLLTERGVQPVRQVAIDDTWSALRFPPRPERGPAVRSGAGRWRGPRTRPRATASPSGVPSASVNSRCTELISMGASVSMSAAARDPARGPRSAARYPPTMATGSERSGMREPVAARSLGAQLVAGDDQPDEREDRRAEQPGDRGREVCRRRCRFRPRRRAVPPPGCRSWRSGRGRARRGTRRSRRSGGAVPPLATPGLRGDRPAGQRGPGRRGAGPARRRRTAAPRGVADCHFLWATSRPSLPRALLGPARLRLPCAVGEPGRASGRLPI